MSAQAPRPARVPLSALTLCQPDSPDAGSGRIRLPYSVWEAAGIPYHKPVLVSIGAGVSQWRLLCTSALLPEAANGAVQAAAAAVADARVVCAPSDCTLQDLWQLVQGGCCPAATAAACRSPPVTATAIEVEVPDGLEHLPLLRPKLHQALVLQGCFVALSERVSVRVASIQPRPTSADQPFRIVPSTHITLAAAGSAAVQPRASNDLQSAAAEGAAGVLLLAASPPGAAGGAATPPRAKSAAGVAVKGSSSKLKKAVADVPGEGSAGQARPAASAKAAHGSGESADGQAAGAEAEAEAGAGASAGVGSSGSGSSGSKPKKKKSSSSSKSVSKAAKGGGLAASASVFGILEGLEDE